MDAMRDSPERCESPVQSIGQGRLRAATAVNARASEAASRAFGVACIVAMAFALYASVVPLDYAREPLHLALARFTPPPWIALDALGRADWLVHVLLYAPLATCAFAALRPAASRFAAWLRGMLVVGGLGVFAVTIEFAQLWFPPRSVTANDVAAAWLGLALGTVAWICARARIRHWAALRFADASGARSALALLFVFSYLAAALFPLDIDLSAAALEAKLARGFAGWWTAPAACAQRSLCVAGAIAHVAAGIAFGAAWTMVRLGGRRVTWLGAIASGVAIATAIELVQLAMASGVAQGNSAIARALGIIVGLPVGGRVERALDWALDATPSRAVRAATAVAYLVLLAAASGLVTSEWGSLDAALARLRAVSLVPFYHHYYASEQRAFASTLVQLALYAPVGAWTALALRARGSTVLAAWTAGLVALAVEFAQAMAGRAPDATHVLLAAMSAYAAHVIVRWLVDLRAQTRVATTRPSRPRVVFMASTPFALVGVAVCVLGVLAYPGPRLLVALGLIVLALSLARHPGAWLVVVPALIGVLDLGQWTNALYLDEFDLVAICTITVLCFRRPRSDASHWSAPMGFAVVTVLALTVPAIVAAVTAAHPFPPDTFATVHSPANAWRVGRGMLWGVLLALLVRRWSGDPATDMLRWAHGMTIGLVLVSVALLWERTTYGGWGAFFPSYHAVGVLASAATGGAQTEAFLAAAIPFALLIAATAGQSTVWRIVAITGAVLAGFAIVATVSRAAFAAAGLGVFLFSVGLALHLPTSRSARRSLGYIFPAAGLIVGAGIFVVGERFADTAGDIAARRAHWTELVEFSDVELGRTLLGHGLGSYPTHYYVEASPARRPSVFSYRNEHDASFLRAFPGHRTYLDQVVPADPGASYTLRGVARSGTGSGSGAIVFTLCKKWMLQSADCGNAATVPASSSWQPFEVTLAAPVERRMAALRATQKLSMYLAAGSAAVDVTAIELIDGTGRNLVRNGEFADPGAHWLVASNLHWAWNTFNLLVEVLFEQGVLALALLVGALAYVFSAIGRRATRGDLVAAAYAAGLAAFLVPSVFDALLDEPRMRLLAGLLVAIPLLVRSRRHPTTGPP